MTEIHREPEQPGLVAVASRDAARFFLSEGYRALIGQMKERAPQEPFQHLLVVDNSGVSSPPLTRESGEVLVRVIYEPQVGIPFARNAALTWAQSGNYKWIAFLDDDVVPTGTWLEEMLFALRGGSHDAIQGSWVFSYESSYPNYLPRMSDSSWIGNEALRTASTRNVIFCTKKVFESGAKFNESLAEIGGSDTEFFMSLNNSGFQIGTTTKGLVNEPIVGKRASLLWHLRRKIRTDQTWFVSIQKFGRPAISMKKHRSSPKLVARTLFNRVFSASSLHVTTSKGKHVKLPQLVLLPLTALSFTLLGLGIRVREYQRPKAVALVNDRQS